MEQNLNRIEVKNVNGGSNRELSSVRGANDPQLNLDLYQVTAGKHKSRSRVKSVKIATCNVRTLYQSGKLENIKKEIDR